MCLLQQPAIMFSFVSGFPIIPTPVNVQRERCMGKPEHYAQLQFTEIRRKQNYSHTNLSFALFVKKWQDGGEKTILAEYPDFKRCFHQKCFFSESGAKSEPFLMSHLINP
jgi:hypothetical protein